MRLKMEDEIRELKQEIDDLIAEHEQELELKNLKIEELEREIRFLQNGADLLVDKWLELEDVDYQNEKLLDENDRLKLSLMYSRHK